MLRFLRTSTNLLVEARTRSRARQATAGQAPETRLASELSRGDSPKRRLHQGGTWVGRENLSGRGRIVSNQFSEGDHDRDH